MNRSSLTLATWFLIGYLALGSSSHAACLQEPTVQIAIETEEIFVGESFTLQAVVEGIETANAPDVTQLEQDFAVQFETEQSMNATSVVFLNGRMTRKEELKTLYQYRITPKKSGRLTIPPVTIEVDGRVISSQTREINVLEPEPQELVIVETSSDKTKVYPTQSFQISLKVLVRALPDNNQDPLIPIRRNPPNISIPWIEEIDGLKTSEDKGRWLQNLLSDQGYGFSINDFSSRSGFLFDGPRVALFDLVRGKETRKLENGEEAEFFRYEINQSFTAVRPGVYTFGPATVRGTFVVDSRGREYRGKKIAATTKPIDVVVSEVPNPRPSNFLGGVGKFSASIEVSPKEARIGDPMTLTLEVTGPTDDSLEQVYAPDLSQLELISKDFEVMDRSPVGKVDRNNKTFTYGIRPKNMLDTFPELEFSSFDPNLEQFIPIKTAASSLKVEQGTALASKDLTGLQMPNPTAIKQDRTGIFQGTREMYPLTNDAISVTTWTGIAGASWIAALAGAAWIRFNRLRVKDSAAERLSRARLTSLQHIRNAKANLETGNSGDAIASVRQAIVSLVGAVRGGDGQGLTTGDVLEALRSTSLSEQDRQAVSKILETIDSARYGRLSDTDATEMIDRAEVLNQSLYSALASSASKLQKKQCSIVLMFVLATSPFGTETPTQSASTDEMQFEQILNDMESSQSKEQFAAVAVRLEELEKRGLKSGSLHFHCGNAWYQAGLYGNAIRQYRLAKIYLPQDSYLQANLEQALSAAPGKLSNQNRSGTLDNILFWSGWLSYPMKIQTSVLLWVASAALFLSYAAFRKSRLLLGCLLGMVMAATMLGEALFRSPERFVASYGVLNAETIVRKGMGDDFAPAFDRPLLDGAEFEVLQRTSLWTLGRFPGIGDGWVKNQNVAGM